jgi:hypothetical protein
MQGRTVTVNDLTRDLAAGIVLDGRPAEYRRTRRSWSTAAVRHTRNAPSAGEKLGYAGG